MKAVEQAIFTSVETDRQSGYQVLAHSPGVCDADLGELAAWEPSRDSMHETGPEAESFNFHPLPSGAYCLSRTTLNDGEQDGGPRVYTHCLIVPPEVLDRFANHPFPLLQVVSEHCVWQPPNVSCPPLASFVPPDGPASLDPALLARWAADLGAQKVAALGPPGTKLPLSGRGRCGSAHGLDGRAIELSACGLPAGVFLLHRAEVLAATAVPRGDALR